jgi:hypothetical protein
MPIDDHITQSDSGINYNINERTIIALHPATATASRGTHAPTQKEANRMSNSFKETDLQDLDTN